MKVLLWILNILNPIILIAAVGYFAMGDIEDWVLYAGAGSALLGLIIGFTGWGETVPPRWFWVKSSVDLLDSRIFTALSYAFQFFCIPAATACSAAPVGSTYSLAAISGSGSAFRSILPLGVTGMFSSRM